MSSERTFFGHPRGLAVLFFAELWERFSFYGMRALLMLYLTATVADGGLEFETSKAAAIYALYTSMVYLLGLPGGWLADRILGQRRSVLYGGILITAGHFSLAVPSLAFFYLGLILIVCGTGMLKPNISTIVGQLYTKGDDRRDAGFSLFYMGINLGAFGGPLVCNWLGEQVSWHLGFAAAGVGMVFGMIVYLVSGRDLGEAGMRPATADDPVESAAAHRTLRRGGLIALSLVVIGALVVRFGGLALDADSISNAFGYVLVLICVGFFAWLFMGHPWTAEERGRLWTIVILFLAAAFFWGAYEQAGSSLNLFARDFTSRSLFGWEFPAGYFQSVPALFVILQAPLFAWLWVRMGRRQPSSPLKFSLGLVFVGLGFVTMSIAATSGNQVSPMWLVSTYFLHVIGEMCLSPVGLSVVTKLAPERVTSLMMGVWFLAASLGNYAGGRTAGLYESLSLSQLFGAVAATTIVAGLILGLLSKRIHRMTGGIR